MAGLRGCPQKRCQPAPSQPAISRILYDPCHPLSSSPCAGEWVEGVEGADAALRAATPSSSSDLSMPSSSCPEEVSWPPLAGGDAPGGGGDCYAAVNLMTMSAKARTAGVASSLGGAASPALSVRGCSARSSALELEQFNHDSLAAMAARYEGSAPTPPHKVRCGRAGGGWGCEGLLVGWVRGGPAVPNSLASPPSLQPTALT